MRLKTIAEKVEINKPLTSHIARHSYRQLLAEAGLKDIASIKTMMGHSRSGDIDAVYHSVTEKQLLEAKKQLQKFLDKLFK
jgi:site-specific recombinase XerD